MIKKLLNITIILILSSYANAVKVQLPVLQDSYVSLTNPAVNYNSATVVQIARQSSNTIDRYPYIQFDISRIYGIDSSRIISATLKMYKATATNMPGGQVSRVIAPWDGTLLNWNNMPAATDVAGSTWATSASITTIEYNTFADVKQLVQNWASGQWANYGIRMRPYGAGGYGMAQFDSKEETTRGLHPVIEVEIEGELTGERNLALNIVQDSYVNSSAPAANYGTLNQLVIARDVVSNREAYLQFELSGLTGITADKIESATLKLHRALLSGGDTSGILGRVTSQWSGSTITWNSSPTTTETDGYIWAAGSGDGYNSAIDITDLVKNWRGGVWPNYGLRLRLASGAYCMMIMDSSEETTRNLRPVIEVKLKTTGAFDVPFWQGAVGTPAVKTDDNGNVWKFCEVSGRSDEFLRWSSYDIMEAVFINNERYWQGVNAVAKGNTEGRLGRISGFYEPYVYGQWSNRFDGAIVFEPFAPAICSWYGQVYCRVWSYKGPVTLEFVKFSANDFPTHIHTEIINEGTVFDPNIVDLGQIEAIQNISVKSGERIAMVAKTDNYNANVVAEFETPVGINLEHGGCSENAKPVGDFNGDCVVDTDDLAIFVREWLNCSDPLDSNCY